MANAFEQVVDDGLRAFNVDRFYGGETSLRQVIETARTLPMMAPRRVVIVLRAERSLTPKRESQTAAADLEAFEAYLADPQPHASLILVAGALDKRRRTTMRLLKAATVVTCGVIESLDDGERWVRRRVAKEGLAIEPAAARLLAAQAGPDLTRLRGDVERLLLFVAGQSSVRVDDVREIAGPVVAHDDWAVARAIERGADGSSPEATGAGHRVWGGTLHGAGTAGLGGADQAAVRAAPGGSGGAVQSGPGAEDVGRQSPGPAGATRVGALR